ncbi:MAG: glycosyltransferase family 2 protein [Caldilineaceae bacterium]|nr:glycosyltransferase family 2 protein [Caldilineaceae bacterium]
MNQPPRLGIFPADVHKTGTPGTPDGEKSDQGIDLSIIIVSWNVWDLLRASLDSIEQVSRDVGAPATVRAFGPSSHVTSKIPGSKIPNAKVPAPNRPTLEVIVVDNASSDATAELLPARFPWVRFIRSATNLGFTAGNNLGYAASRGRAIYFLNPDTELIQTAPHGDSLWTLYRALISEPKVGLVGPQLRYANNTLQSSRRRFPTRATGFADEGALGRYWHNNPWQRQAKMDEWPATFRQEVDWLVGAALLARRAALEAVRQPGATGPFDETFFMYYEETDLCYRLKQAGWQIVYVPEATVVHYEGRSSEQAVAARDIHYARSKIRYYEKYFGSRWAAFLRAFLLWNFRGQWMIEAAKWLLGHKRALRAQRMAAYREVLATRLRPKQ